MQDVNHSLAELFAQLGLPTSTDAIEAFIEAHRPLPAQQKIYDAEFWSPAQATFLRECRAEDADWAELVDELSVRLH